jgi:DNA-binding transcriptional MocR family regulator
MSYKERLTHIDRGSQESVTSQIVGAFSDAIESGELEPGEKLPPTRDLAEIAGVNHLTAARAYRRLSDLGLVTGRVGSGTFVRTRSATAAEPSTRDARGTAWQLYALPDEIETYGDRILAEMFRYAGSEELIPLMVGHPSSDLFPVERIAELAETVLRDDGARALQYADIEGMPELREELASLGRRRGTDDRPGEIVVTTGADQAMTLATRAVLRPGDVAACESPSFIGGIEAVRNTGARVLSVPMDKDGLDIDALEQLLRRHEIRLLVVQPRLQNPTGRDLVPERRERLCELARRHGFFIVEDAIYGDLRLEGDELPPLRAMAPEHVIYVDSFSKNVAPGMRLGWAAATGPVLDRIVREKRNDDMASGTLPQLIGARFLAEGSYDQHLPGAIEFHRERRDAVLAALGERLEGLATWERPLGGAHAWLELRDPLDERDLYAEAVRQGTTFLPGGAAMVERPRGTYMRVSFAYLRPDELREGVRRLAAAVRTVRGSTRPREAMPIT